MNTNPIVGFFRTLYLFIVGRVKLYPEDIGKEFKMEDSETFTVFRHVKIKPSKRQKAEPEAVFTIRFKPSDMSVEKNTKFSRLPMMVFMGFKGFRSKYWMVNYETGMCQGVYEWQTYKDAINYSRSIAVKFMTKRSEEGSVTFGIEKRVEDD